MGKISGIYQCPSCSAAITFRSETTRIKICTCGAVVHRLESDELILKTVPVITGSNDLLQPGTQGSYDGFKFEILGRFRLWLEESVFNYWTISFADGTTTLLAEGYGLYAILKKTTLGKAVTGDQLKTLAPAQPIELFFQEKYFLKTGDHAWKYEIEGEVFLPECNDAFPVFDLYAKDDKHIQLFEFLPGYLVAYSVLYTEFQRLKLTGLNTSPIVPKEIVCPGCKSRIQVMTWPYAQSCSCTQCGARSAFNQKNENFQRISADISDRNELSLALRSKGTIKNIAYEVVGYALKEDDSEYHWRWKEYVLYNREEGYAFLSEYAGNWIYAREKGDSPVIATDNPVALDYKGREFKLYNKYRIKIVDTAGEFPYNIFDDKQAQSAEFIDPPYMWVYEKSREEGISWFLSEHIDWRWLAEQFQSTLPYKEEKGVLEPRGFTSYGQLGIATAIAIAVLFVTHFCLSFTQPDRMILDTNIPFRDSGTTITFVSSKFELTKWRNNLEFDISAPVENTWVDLGITLVNNSTGTEQSVGQLVQYYHGYEDGESWSEGSNQERTYMSGIPSGTYFLRIEMEREKAYSWGSLSGADLTVRANVPNHRNFFIILGLLLIYPSISFYFIRVADMDRWSGSPYSPYNKNRS